MEELLWLVVGVGGVLFAIQKPWLTVLLLLLLLLALTNYDHIRPLLETAFVGLSEQHRQRRSQERGFVPRIEPVFARREHSAGETTPPVDEEQDSPSATHSLSDFFQSRFERLFRIRTYQVPRMVEYYEGMTTSFSSPSPPSSPMSLSVTGAADELEDYPLTRASSRSSSPIRRCRSLELRHIFSVRRDHSVDRPASRNESKRHATKMFVTPTAAEFELATSASRLPPLPSAATLKARLKGAFHRTSVGVKGANSAAAVVVPRSSSHESVGQTKPDQSSSSPAAVNGNQPSSVKTRADGNKDRVPMARKELDSCLRYFQEVVRTGKVEMLTGSTAMILDSVLNLISAFHANAKDDDRTTYKGLYDAVIVILQLADTHVSARAAKRQEDDAAVGDLVGEKDATNAMIEHLKTVVAELATSVAANRLSADSAVSSSTVGGGEQRHHNGDSSTSSSTPPPLPPRPSKNKRPLSPDHKRKTSPPVSTDSGIFGDAPMQISTQEGGRESQLFSETSLDDLLAQLNLTNKVAKFAPEFPKIDQDDSDDDTTNDSGVLVDERREERSENHGSKICEEEIQETPDGRQIRTTKTRTVMKKQSSTQMTITTSGGGGDEMVRKFTDGSNSFRDDSDFKIDRFGAFFGSSGGRRPYSPYDNRPPSGAEEDDNNEVRVESPPPLPPRLNRPGALATTTQQPSEEGGAVVKRNRLVTQQSATLQSVSRRATKNGKVVADDAAHKLDTQALKASQSDTFHEGELVDRQGGGAYEEQSLVRYDRALKNKEKHRSQSKSPPPIPPKRRHVVQYMQIFGGKSPKGDANNDDQRPNSQTDFLKQSTLTSYVVLRDNLRQYEEQYHKKTLHFQFGGGSAGNDAIPMPGPASYSQHDYNNLTDLLQLSDLERFRLPTRFEGDEGAVDDSETQKAITFPERLAIEAAPTVLEALDITDWLVLRAKEGSGAAVEVRGGPKDALVAFATQPSDGSLLYQEAFLTTYRTFVTSVELIRKLVQRYRYFALSSDQAQKKAARNTFSLLVRVVDDLCAVEMTRELIGHVTSFVYWLIRDGNITFSRLLRKRLMDRVEEKAGFKRAAPLHDAKPSTPTHRGANVLELRSTAIAQQMTFLDAELFQKIDLAEMLWWAQEQCDEKSPNLAAFTEHFNKMSYWVRTLVVQQPEGRDREKYLLKFIKVMKNLRRMGNFNSYLAILSALDSGPVRRLDWSKNAIDQLKEHSSVMDSSHSFRNYRTLLAETRPPCLPYIGLILQDLTFVHVGNSNFLQPAQCQGRTDLLNFGKRWQQFAILDSVRRFKSWHYPIDKDEKIQRVFGGFNYFLSEDETWELSETIKPRSGGRKSKPA